jgi:hypothetical protein
MFDNFKHFPFFLLIIATMSSCAQRKPKLYKVSGIVTATYSYCGGARPSDEMLAELNRPKPLADKKLFIKTGSSNSKSNSAIKEFTTDADGHFTIALEKGTYCIVEENKSASMIIPASDANHKWDVNCLTKEYERCDFQLNINKQPDSISINFLIPCEWNKPCVTYTGPLPPAAQQRY